MVNRNESKRIESMEILGSMHDKQERFLMDVFLIKDVEISQIK